MPLLQFTCSVYIKYCISDIDCKGESPDWLIPGMEVVVSAWSSQVHSSPAAENLPFRMAGQEDPSPEGKSAHCWQVVAIKSYVNAFRYLWVRKMESNHQIFHFPLCCLFLKSVMESYWRHSSYNIVDRLATRAHSLCGHQQLHTKLDSECWPNYTSQNQVCLQFAKWISDVICLVSVTLNT